MSMDPERACVNDISSKALNSKRIQNNEAPNRNQLQQSAKRFQANAGPSDGPMAKRVGQSTNSMTVKDGIDYTRRPRPHQVEAVKTVMQSIRGRISDAQTPSQPFATYLLQHCAGSGKTLTICALVKELMELKESNGAYHFNKILVVTHRLNLQEQLYNQLRKIMEANGKSAKDYSLVDNVSSIAQKLALPIPVLVVTIQKLVSFTRIRKEFKLPSLKHIAIVGDEIHTHHDIDDDNTSLSNIVEMFKTMHTWSDPKDGAKSQPAAPIVYIGFTATPGIKTLKQFGEKGTELTSFGKKLTVHTPFHTYSLKEALEKNHVLDVLGRYTCFSTKLTLRTNALAPGSEEKAAKELKDALFGEIHSLRVLHKQAKQVAAIVKKLVIDSQTSFPDIRFMLVTRSRPHVLVMTLLLRYYLRTSLRQENMGHLEHRVFGAFSTKIEWMDMCHMFIFDDSRAVAILWQEALCRDQECLLSALRKATNNKAQLAYEQHLASLEPHLQEAHPMASSVASGSRPLGRQSIDMRDYARPLGTRAGKGANAARAPNQPSNIRSGARVQDEDVVRNGGSTNGNADATAVLEDEVRNVGPDCPPGSNPGLGPSTSKPASLSARGKRAVIRSKIQVQEVQGPDIGASQAVGSGNNPALNRTTRTPGVPETGRSTPLGKRQCVGEKRQAELMDTESDQVSRAPVRQIPGSDLAEVDLEFELEAVSRPRAPAVPMWPPSGRSTPVVIPVKREEIELPRGVIPAAAAAAAVGATGPRKPNDLGRARGPQPASSLQSSNTKKAKKDITESSFNTGLTVSAARVLVVCGKYIVGYDDPRLSCMFIMKPMKGLECVQVLSRINRVAFGKGPDHVHVFDYVNPADRVKRAFEPFMLEARVEVDERGQEVPPNTGLVIQQKAMTVISLLKMAAAEKSRVLAGEADGHDSDGEDAPRVEPDPQRPLYMMTVPELGGILFDHLGTEPYMRLREELDAYIRLVRDEKLVYPELPVELAVPLQRQLEALHGTYETLKIRVSMDDLENDILEDDILEDGVGFVPRYNSRGDRRKDPAALQDPGVKKVEIAESWSGPLTPKEAVVICSGMRNMTGRCVPLEVEILRELESRQVPEDSVSEIVQRAHQRRCKHRTAGKSLSSYSINADTVSTIQSTGAQRAATALNHILNGPDPFAQDEPSPQARARGSGLGVTGTEVGDERGKGDRDESAQGEEEEVLSLVQSAVAAFRTKDDYSCAQQLDLLMVWTQYAHVAVNAKVDVSRTTIPRIMTFGEALQGTCFTSRVNKSVALAAKELAHEWREVLPKPKAPEAPVMPPPPPRQPQPPQQQAGAELPPGQYPIPPSAPELVPTQLQPGAAVLLPGQYPPPSGFGPVQQQTLPPGWEAGQQPWPASEDYNPFHPSDSEVSMGAQPSFNNISGNLPLSGLHLTSSAEGPSAAGGTNPWGQANWPPGSGPINTPSHAPNYTSPAASAPQYPMGLETASSWGQPQQPPQPFELPPPSPLNGQAHHQPPAGFVPPPPPRNGQASNSWSMPPPPSPNGTGTASQHAQSSVVSSNAVSQPASGAAKPGGLTLAEEHAVTPNPRWGGTTDPRSPSVVKLDLPNAKAIFEFEKALVEHLASSRYGGTCRANMKPLEAWAKDVLVELKLMEKSGYNIIDLSRFVAERDHNNKKRICDLFEVKEASGASKTQVLLRTDSLAFGFLKENGLISLQQKSAPPENKGYQPWLNKKPREKEF